MKDMNNLIHNNKIFIPYEYKTEKEFEQEIVIYPAVKYHSLPE
jgi:hypothetical protein